jgi:hypothetical protein
MSHTCEDCGETFNTLSRLRLHDCSPDDTPAAAVGNDSNIEQLDELLADIENDDIDALHQAMAIYETQQATAHEQENNDQYQEISRTYREPLITALDDATQARGWTFLDEFIDAYHPKTADDFPHVTTILQNVTSRFLIRVRVTDTVETIPVEALEYFDAILNKVESEYGYIKEGLHPYGWGIGHPEHSVADRIHAHATEDIFVVNPMLEHAFYADQYAAMDLLERMIHDDAIQHTFQHPSGELTEVRHLLDAPAGAASDFWPTIPRYWDWHEEVEYDFELADEIEQRIRSLVQEHGLDKDLPNNWEITDLTL